MGKSDWIATAIVISFMVFLYLLTGCAKGKISLGPCVHTGSALDIDTGVYYNIYTCENKSQVWEPVVSGKEGDQQ